jgi:hypothetical protein
MPDLDAIAWPPPANWQDFQRLCCDLYQSDWNDPTTAPNGREGQPQNGVDVYGRREGQQMGVQCKGKDADFGKKVSKTELLAEVEKAKSFKPPLRHFYLATTAPTDGPIQEIAREITQQHEEKGLFTVNVVGWQQLRSLLAKHESVLRKHYAALFAATQQSQQMARLGAMLFREARYKVPDHGGNRNIFRGASNRASYATVSLDYIIESTNRWQAHDTKLQIRIEEQWCDVTLFSPDQVNWAKTESSIAQYLTSRAARVESPPKNLNETSFNIETDDSRNLQLEGWVSTSNSLDCQSSYPLLIFWWIKTTCCAALVIIGENGRMVRVGQQLFLDATGGPVEFAQAWADDKLTSIRMSDFTSRSSSEAKFQYEWFRAVLPNEDD